MAANRTKLKAAVDAAKKKYGTNSKQYKDALAAYRGKPSTSSTTPELTTSQQIDKSVNQTTGVDQYGNPTSLSDWEKLIKIANPEKGVADKTLAALQLGMGMVTPTQLDNPNAAAFQGYLSQAERDAATEDPRMAELYRRFLAQSEGGSPEETALREELLSNMQGDLQSGLRQANIAGAGRGIVGPANQILYEPFMRDFSNASRGAQRDIVARRDSMLDRAGTAADWLETNRLNKFNNMVNLRTGIQSHGDALQAANNDNMTNYQMYLWTISQGVPASEASKRYGERALDIAAKGADINAKAASMPSFQTSSNLGNSSSSNTTNSGDSFGSTAGRGNVNTGGTTLL